MTEISVIIVNYCTAALAIEAVESVRARYHGGRRVDIHVVDNGSPGEDAAMLATEARTRGWGDQVKLYPEAENHGFGRGNNLVLRELLERPSPPDKVFFMNPDAQLEGETISILADFLDRSTEIAIVGCRIGRPNGAPVVAAFRFPSLVSEFCGALNLGPVSRLFSKWSVARPLSMPSGRTDWVSGAAFMAKLEVISDVGLFDPRYFLYFEETDLMRRVTLAGWHVWHLREACVRHVAGAATGMVGGRVENRRTPSYWYVSWLIYFVSNHGIWYARVCATIKLLGFFMNVFFRTLQGRKGDAPAAFGRDFWSFVIRPLFSHKGRAGINA